MRTLIGNLLENAIKFTPEGGMVQLELGRSVDAIYLRVIDTGIGIPAGRCTKPVFALLPRTECFNLFG